MTPELLSFSPLLMVPWPDLNPRKRFDEDRINELAESIRANGMLQPIIVHAHKLGEGEGKQMWIVAGESRWRAAKRLSLSAIPCLVGNYTRAQALEIAIIENLQREGLTAVEEARGFKDLMEETGCTQAEVADKAKKSQPYVANRLRLLDLPEPVLELLQEGVIQASAARDAFLPLLRMPEELGGRAIDRLLGWIDSGTVATDGPALAEGANQVRDQIQREFGSKGLFDPVEPNVDPEAAAERGEQSIADGSPTEPNQAVDDAELDAAEKSEGARTVQLPKADSPATAAAAPAPAPSTPKATPAAAPAPPPAETPAPAAEPLSTLPLPGTAREVLPEGAGFVTAIMTATSGRLTVITLNPIKGGRVALTVAPMILKAGETPLAQVGTLAELDEAFVSAIDTHFTS